MLITCRSRSQIAVTFLYCGLILSDVAYFQCPGFIKFSGNFSFRQNGVAELVCEKSDLWEVV